MEKGIVPIGQHRQYGILSENTDATRAERRLLSTSLSVTFPNYKMKYFKQNNTTLVILGINPEILYKNTVKTFHSKNAACWDESIYGSNSYYFNNFLEMFANEELRGKLELPNNYTTDPQAEILFEGVIEPNYIQKIYVEKAEDKFIIAEQIIMPEIIDKVEINPFIFSYRKDWEYWRKEY